jgi:hypothetical protein
VLVNEPCVVFFFIFHCYFCFLFVYGLLAVLSRFLLHLLLLLLYIAFLLPCFLLDNKPSRQRDAFKPVSFEQNKLSALLQGSKHEGEGLVLARTRYLRDFFKEPNMNGFPKQFWFAGTSNPLVGAATVLGGGGNVGSYLGTYSFLAFLSIFHFP